MNTVSRHLSAARSTWMRSTGLQAALLLSLWALAGWAVGSLDLPLPAGVAGMAVLLLLLASGALKPVSVRRGADWFLTHMLLFFVPASVSVLEHPELLSGFGLRLLLAVLAGTLLVMGGTALAVELCLRWRPGRAG